MDLLAIRKDHQCQRAGLKRGDLFEIILIQVKRGSAERPTAHDLVRLSKVSEHHKAKAVVLVEWQREKKLAVFKLNKTMWRVVDPAVIFG